MVGFTFNNIVCFNSSPIEADLILTGDDNKPVRKLGKIQLEEKDECIFFQLDKKINNILCRSIGINKKYLNAPTIKLLLLDMLTYLAYLLQNSETNIVFDTKTFVSGLNPTMSDFIYSIDKLMLYKLYQ